MGNQVRFILLVGVLLMGFSPALGDELFQYSVTSYPKDSTLGCSRTAQELGRRFSTVTGKKLFRATCDSETRFGYNLTLTYISQSSASHMSTRKESGGYGGYLGVYRSLEECERHLSSEIRWFEDSTGLRHFLAYCFQETDINETPFAAYVDGFGSARLWPYRFEATLYGNVFSSSDWAKDLFDLAIRAGIGVKQVKTAHDGSNKLVVRYYDSPENVIFQSGYFVLPSSGPFFPRIGNEVATFYSYEPRKTRDACLFSGEKILSSFAPEFMEKSIWFCTWDPMLFKAALYVVRVKPVSTATGEMAPLRYNTFSDCETDRKDVLELYKSELKKDVIGAICSWQSGFGTGKPDGYFVRVFVRKKE